MPEDIARPTGAAPSRTLSVRWSTLVTSAALATLLIATVVLAVLYSSARSDLADRDRREADARRAEQIATDYAVGASTIDYRDARAWFDRLESGTTPELAAKFDATATQLEQVLLPLQWTSTANPLSATVISESDGRYKVNAYLTVSSTSVQNPEGAQTTVTYSLTIDRNADWKISEVGGLQNAIAVR
ncbi:hypothetical protein [Nocardia puris]|uniref:hypothetical protein n=1 Tax=Nocardia puris TaxID=208602 RepID=UPI001E453387|nr:hypothetical protein [Nocardia puris]